jgi:hypothetical protein
MNIGSPGFRRKAVQYGPVQNAKHLQKVIDNMYGPTREIFELKRDVFNGVVPNPYEKPIGGGKDLLTILRK